ncbi:hypothetical protein [Desulfosarcina ovata]|uniref:Uncharacterized protein n=1 Tax=Desulfosarcina ovata subsp. ovata TaxID=2752305 RepID=A0A5K8ABA8_9BACT|nr:hypothetical protein [Desulfosarcina ovata]BBO89932.1 hypothetical protein DSCOOX_31120 [Desulfosarcina ovata subsp. ovata]
MTRSYDNQTPEQLISRAIDTLERDIKQILILRNGRGQTPGLPYEELENQTGQPIECLIAMEKKAIRRLRHPSVAKWIVKAVKKADNTIWQTLANEDNVVYKDDLNRQFITGLPGELLIGIKCLYDNVSNWLDHHSHQNPIAWYRSEYPEKVIITTIQEVIDQKERIHMPLPFQQFVEQMNVESRLLKQVLALSTNKISTYRGYVCNFRFRARTVRAIRIHLMFCCHHPNQILPLEQIHAEYVETYSDDDALLADIVLSMTDNPHMFVRLGSLGWYTIMAHTVKVSHIEKKEFFHLQLPDEDKSQFFYKRPDFNSFLLDTIKDFVRKQGMVRPVEVDTYIRENYQDRINESTQIAPLVAGALDLLQVSPTCYALRETHSRLDSQNAAAKLLLTKSDLRWYIMSRYAGEPMHTFPLWTPKMEYMWSVWAQKNATNPSKNRLFQSLMAVADPTCWPVPEKEKNSWLETKKWSSSYYLSHPCKHHIWTKIPPLRDFLALSIGLQEFGDMNWIRVNRLAGYYLFDQHSVTSLAILIALEALKPTDHWQQPHQMGPMAKELLKTMTDAFQLDPKTNWDSDLGSQLIKQLVGQISRSDFGWVSSSDLALLAKTLLGEPVGKEDEQPSTNSFLPKQLELPF